MLFPMRQSCLPSLNTARVLTSFKPPIRELTRLLQPLPPYPICFSPPGTPISHGPCLSFPMHNNLHWRLLCDYHIEMFTTTLPTSPTTVWELHLCAEHSLWHISNGLTLKITCCFPFYWWGDWDLKRIINFLADSNSQMENLHSYWEQNPYSCIWLPAPFRGPVILSYKYSHTSDILLPFCLQSYIQQNIY